MADDHIQVFIDNDGLVATISLAAGHSRPTGAVAAALDDAGVVHGIIEKTLVELEARIGDEKFEIEEKLIAQATPGDVGRDGELVLDFSPGPLAGMARTDGSLDLLNRGLLHRVSTGDSLGFIRPPSSGTPGITVTGEKSETTTAGKELVLTLGDGVELKSGGAISAVRDGAVQFRPGAQLDVLHHYEHQGDVDIRSGHLETNGSVTISGTVNANFRVSAEGDVEVRGAVIGGRVIADGKVLVGGAITAGEDGRVDAGGDIIAKHAQIAKLRSGGDVSLTTDCVGTQVRARRLEVGRSLLGGEAIVETEIKTKVAGSPSGAGTILAVGEPFDSNRKSPAEESATNKTKRQIARRKSTGTRGSRTGRGKQSREQLSLERESVKRYVERSAARAKLLKVAVIEIEDTVNVGVSIRFGSRRLDIETALGSTRFQFDEAQNCITMERQES